MESNFSTTANIFVRIFFTLIRFNLWTNFIEIIRLDNLLMLFKATSLCHSSSPHPTPRGLRPQDPDQGTLPPEPSLISEYVRLWVFNKKKLSGVKGRGLFILWQFFPSAFFSIGYLFLRSIFPLAFFPSAFFPGHFAVAVFFR